MYKKIIGLALTVGLAGAAGVAVTTPAEGATSASAVRIDSYVTKASKSGNYATAKSLVVDGRTASTAYALAKVDVPTGSQPDSVELSLRPTVSSTVGIRVYATGQSWDDTTVTWANKPVERTLLGQSDALTSGVMEHIVLDTAAVAPGSVLSLRIETTATKALRFDSAEATTVSSRPSLQVTTTDTTPTDPTPPPSTGSFPPATPVVPKTIGMSAPSNLWDQRISEVGANGVKARRIFATLSSSGSSSLPLIKQSIAAGMMPVISYKVPSVDTMISGGYDSWLATLRTQLVALNAPVTATFWHEPHGDMTPAQFRAASLKFFNTVDAPSIAVGPILNGWLLDNRVADFASYTDANLLNKWEFVAVDSYQSGTVDSPGASMPARAIPLLENWMDSVGHPDTPLGVGEYNGFTAKAIADAGEVLLSTPEVWFGLAWNSQGGSYAPLTGDRITAFQKTKADARAMR